MSLRKLVRIGCSLGVIATAMLGILAAEHRPFGHRWLAMCACAICGAVVLTAVIDAPPSGGPPKEGE